MSSNISAIKGFGSFRRFKFLSLSVVALVTALAGCTSSPTTQKSSSSGTKSNAHGTAASITVHSPRSGVADSAFAGSLLELNEKTLGPNFTTSTGYRYQGEGNGSFAIANLIKSGQIQPNVFESIGSAPIGLIEPKFTNYFVSIATSPLVVAYNPKGPFGSQLAKIANHKLPIANLFSIMAQPGFHLGRTDPLVDPQGQAFILMLDLAVRNLGVSPKEISQIIGGSYEDQSQLFTETSLDSYLQTGQLDAASAFLSQAVQLHLSYISLPPEINLGDSAMGSKYANVSIALSNGEKIKGATLTVDVTTLNYPGQSPNDRAAAASFLNYLLSPTGRTDFSRAGYSLMTPKLFGSRSSAPSSVVKALG